MFELVSEVIVFFNKRGILVIGSLPPVGVTPVVVAPVALPPVILGGDPERVPILMVPSFSKSPATRVYSKEL